jgi:DinB superfamily
MPHHLDQTIALLTNTPAALNALLRNLPESLTHSTEGEGTWTVYGVIGHLIHGEQTDWIPRARIILDHGESQPFKPFDRTAHQREPQTKPLPQLLDEFAALRAENLTTLRSWNLQPEDLARRGTHPTFGPVTLSQLLATWATHDLTHLHQISRIMAHQNRKAVGPWIKYLGVLHCNGHSS